MSDPESNFNRWFKGEVFAAFAVGSAVAATMVWLMSPIYSLNTQVAVLQNQVSELKSNDLTHIELEITKIDATLENQQSQINDLLGKVTRILAILGK